MLETSHVLVIVRVDVTFPLKATDLVNLSLRVPVQAAVLASLMVSVVAAPALSGPLYVGESSPDPAWDLFGFSGGLSPAEQFVVKRHPEDRFPYLPDEPDGHSVSVGTVTDGRIVNSVPLTYPGRTYGVLPRQYQRELGYGSRELISSLVAASEYVDRVHPGSILWFGNIGRRRGGDIPWSVSHNAGRDADLAFYTTDPDGNLVQPPDLLHYGANGRTREYGGYYRFDTARNWTLVKALVVSPHAQIQYLFISNPLRDRLLEHARARGEPATIVARAARLMQQPGRDIPHDDHLHVRVYCSAFDRTGGCENLGRVHPGVDLHDGAADRRVERAEALLRAGAADTRRHAVDRLALLGGRSQLGLIRRRLSDPEPSVRAAAVDAIASLGGAEEMGWLVLHWEDEADHEVLSRIIAAGGTLGGRAAGLLFAELIGEPRTVDLAGKPHDLRLDILDATAAAARAEPAFGVVELLESEDREVAARAASTLRVLANRSEDSVDWTQQYSSMEAELAASQWRHWLDSAADQTRDQWVSEGFALVGIPMDGRATTAASELASIIDDEREWLGRNAQVLLMRMSRNRPRSLEWSRSDAELYWTRWVRRNSGRIAWR